MHIGMSLEQATSQANHYTDYKHYTGDASSRHERCHTVHKAEQSLIFKLGLIYQKYDNLQYMQGRFQRDRGI
jgi:hypothetical protein